MHVMIVHDRDARLGLCCWTDFKIRSIMLNALATLRSGSTSLARSAIISPARSFTASSTRYSLTNLFDAPELPPLAVSKLTPKGFHLSDNLVVPGGLIFLGGRALLWDVDPPSGNSGGGIEGMWMGWTKERFRVFEATVPRPGQNPLRHSPPDG